MWGVAGAVMMFIGLLFIATLGHSGARDTLISLPEQLEEVKPEGVKPEEMELEPGAQPALGPNGDLLGEKPLPGEDLPEGGEPTDIPVDNAFVGPSPGDELPPEDINPQLPTRIALDDVLALYRQHSASSCASEGGLAGDRAAQKAGRWNMLAGARGGK